MELTREQRAAVEAPDGPVLVHSVAGSGKTRVITHRVAYLIREKKVPPSRIFIATFTNKAADELKERLEKMVPSADAIWAGTLHSLSARLLRGYAHLLGYDASFTIYDESDSDRVLAHVINEVAPGYDEAYARRAISFYRADLIPPEDVADEHLARIYRAYLDYLFRANAMDFDDLIVRMVELMEAHPKARKEIQGLFDHILVDEYQDINHAQSTLYDLLAERTGNLYVVGDAAQSIYSFMGSRVEEILSFTKRHPNARTYVLSENFRSTRRILAAASKLLKDREIVPSSPDPGTFPELTRFFSEEDEAIWIAARISELLDRYPAEEIAVLYRAHHLSLPIEMALMRRGIPYHVMEGTPFHERAVVKDMLAYLSVIVNPKDLTHLARAAQNPRRGIGEGTLNRVAKIAEREGMVPLEVMRRANEFRELSRTADALRSFAYQIERLQSSEGSIATLIDLILKETQYLERMKDTVPEKVDEAIRLINELKRLATDFEGRYPDATLEDFLRELVLLSMEADTGEGVQLLTMHQAKGLEFDVVFVCGLTSDMLPHKKSVMERGEEAIEEERRLLYVAMTRAKKELYLTYPETRLVFDKIVCTEGSPFLEEIKPGIRLYAAAGASR